MESIDLRSVTDRVLARQHLTPAGRSDDILEIVRDSTGLHATGAGEPYLALFTRMNHFTWEQLDAQLYDKKTLCKIRCMRGTLYILTLDMLPAAYAATYPMVEHVSRRYAEYRGVSMAEYPELAEAILDLVRDRQLTTNEIKKALGRPSLHISSLLNLMCDRGLLVRIQGSRKTQNYSYELFSRFFPGVNLQSMNETEGIKQLLRSYFRSFGPVTVDDIAWWTGLTKAKIRQTLEEMKKEIVDINIPELPGEFLTLRSELGTLREKRPAAGPVVNVLPSLDPYLMGYKHRERYLDYRVFNYVFDPAGNVTSTILLDGKICGIWDIDEDKNLVKIHLFDSNISPETLEPVYFKAAAIGEFITGRPVEIIKVAGMMPLTERTYGGFMSPLRDSK